MAFPSGLAGPSGAAWNVGPCCVANVDDVAFARALVAQVSATACIDPKRVYAAGFSMGGGMAHYLACHAADVFAAVAPSSFDLLQENVGDCQPRAPDHGDLLPRQRGHAGAVRRRTLAVVPGMPVTFLGAQATFQKWADDRSVHRLAVGARRQRLLDLRQLPGRRRGGAVHEAGRRQGQGNAGIAWPVLKRHPLP